MELGQYVPTKTHQDVAELLRQRIGSGEIAAGSRLMAQRDLAILLGVSRQSVREALLLLEGEGLVETRRGATGGSFVTSPLRSPRGIRRWVRTHLADLDEICDYRIAVEGQTARLAAARRTRDDLASMRHAITALEELPVSRAAFREADGRFHAAVARAARNSRLEKAVRKSRSDLFIAADAIEYTFEAGEMHEEHLGVFEAIDAQDADRAVHLMVAHIEETRRVVRQLLSGVV